ncbi:MAG TPA: hypothetical protein VIL36_09600 [Acidimicrobiales bacterium]
MTDTQLGDPLGPEPVPGEGEAAGANGAGAAAGTTGTTGADGEAPAKKGWRQRINWKGVIGIAGLIGLAIAVSSSMSSTEGQDLPGPLALGAGYVCHLVGLVCGARAWIALFPPDVDRAALANGMYVSQLTKYLPAGGFVQQASQVALSSQSGVGTAALRLPVFSLCAVAAGATGGALLVFDDDLPAWGRILAVAGLATVAVLDRRLLQLGLRLARRVVKRLPDGDALPDQASILRSYVFMVGNIIAFSAAFVVLMVDTADGVDPLMTGAALAAGWVLGYVAVIFPSGLGVREGVLVAVLAVPNAALLAASIAHRLLGLVAEATLAGVSQLRIAAAARRAS